VIDLISTAEETNNSLLSKPLQLHTKTPKTATPTTTSIPTESEVLLATPVVFAEEAAAVAAEAEGGLCDPAAVTTLALAVPETAPEPELVALIPPVMVVVFPPSIPARPI
jgi:hypothetical protein